MPRGGKLFETLCQADDSRHSALTFQMRTGNTERRSFVLLSKIPSKSYHSISRQSISPLFRARYLTRITDVNFQMSKRDVGFSADEIAFSFVDRVQRTRLPVSLEYSSGSVADPGEFASMNDDSYLSADLRSGCNRRVGSPRSGRTFCRANLPSFSIKARGFA